MIFFTPKIKAVTMIALTGFLCVSSLAHAGINDTATFVLDFQNTKPDAVADTQTTTTVDSTPEFYQVDVNGQTRTRFNATLVLMGSTNLMGANCDLVFDNTKIRVVTIHEARGDLNFDGRANIADVLTLAERFGQPTTENGLRYLDRDATGDSANKIDARDIEVILPFLNEPTLYWTSNPFNEVSIDSIRESVEIFESPEVSNQNGKIDDIVSVLLPRIHPTPAGFGFDGDARIADIVFEVVGTSTGETTISFEDTMAIDEATQITQTEIIDGSVPQSQSVTVVLP